MLAYIYRDLVLQWRHMWFLQECGGLKTRWDLDVEFCLREYIFLLPTIQAPTMHYLQTSDATKLLRYLKTMNPLRSLEIMSLWRTSPDLYAARIPVILSHPLKLHRGEVNICGQLFQTNFQLYTDVRRIMPFSPTKTLKPFDDKLVYPKVKFFLKVKTVGFAKEIIEDLNHYLCTKRYDQNIKYYSAILIDRWLVDDQITSEEFEKKLIEQAKLVGLGLPPEEMGYPLGFSINQRDMTLYSNFAKARKMKLKNRVHENRNYFNFMDVALQFGTYIDKYLSFAGSL